jgi:hypothetical protein
MGHYPADKLKLDVGGTLGVDVTQFSLVEQAAYEKAAQLAEDEIAKQYRDTERDSGDAATKP